ncbi:MAG: ATP-dependent Clp protease ATP-binding subunit ClpX [Sphaerochaetaceae bacterium]|nr:ATP-dependent Clp protease ATP-binding subunit ClpX [Sphaerochaetaceae bacterium]
MGRARVCSLCGSAYSRLITANGVSICEDCAHELNRLFKGGDAEQGSVNSNPLTGPIPTPHELKEFLDQYVIGQDEAKRVLSVAVYNHYKRIKYQNEHPSDSSSPDIDKSNILIVGPTGTGKTLLARTLARKLQVPFAIADATTLTEAGYVGEDVENILLKLIQAADEDITTAEVGIVFIDEIDKIAKKGENVSITRDVSGEGVQQALLKIIEGSVASVPPQGGRKHPNQEMLRINTANILFICGGAFVGLDKVIEKRIATSSMGFGSASVKQSQIGLDQIYKQMLPDDLIKFGLIPEFIGRLPIHVGLNNLGIEDLKRIVTEPRNSIVRQYQASMAMDGVELVFDDSAIDAVATTAYEQKTGARGIRSIIEKAMLEIMYELPSMKNVKKVVITKDAILGTGSPQLLSQEGLVLSLPER